MIDIKSMLKEAIDNYQLYKPCSCGSIAMHKEKLVCSVCGLEEKVI